MQQVVRLDSDAYIWSLAGELKQGELSYVEFIRKFLSFINFTLQKHFFLAHNELRFFIFTLPWLFVLL